MDPLVAREQAYRQKYDSESEAGRVKHVPLSRSMSKATKRPETSNDTGYTCFTWVAIASRRPLGIMKVSSLRRRNPKAWKASLSEAVPDRYSWVKIRATEVENENGGLRDGTHSMPLPFPGKRFVLARGNGGGPELHGEDISSSQSINEIPPYARHLSYAKSLLGAMKIRSTLTKGC